MLQSRIGMAHFFVTSFTARKTDFITAPSVVNNPLFFAYLITNKTMLEYGVR